MATGMGLNVRVQFKVRGLVRVLDIAKGAVRNRIMRKALRAGARVLVVAARARVPVRRKAGGNLTPKGLLKKSLGVKMKTYRGGGVVVAIVGARSKKTQIGVRARGRHAGQAVYENPAKIADLVEKGHKVGLRRGKGLLGAVTYLARKAARKIAGGGGQVPPHPFLVPAVEARQAAAQEAVAAVVRDELARLGTP